MYSKIWNRVFVSCKVVLWLYMMKTFIFETSCSLHCPIITLICPVFHLRIIYPNLHGSKESLWHHCTTEVTMHCNLWCCTSCSVFFGTRPAYFIADMDLFREITVKHFDKFTDRLVSDIKCTTPYCARLGGNEVQWIYMFVLVCSAVYVTVQGGVNCEWQGKSYQLCVNSLHHQECLRSQSMTTALYIRMWTMQKMWYDLVPLWCNSPVAACVMTVQGYDSIVGTE